ncbi:hypothetical protein FZD47_10765 [Bacillus infantis]|uniref:Uncharacterized protein n=1 Tax=Bacillus infantis TaxID=324767 RepID=A0A5D4SQ86_9BACI|nr:hypothetical protein [Bacillus infantis]TYS63976.1 hypothetical protein FZD47_10765 [Bacillus infantis]
MDPRSVRIKKRLEEKRKRLRRVFTSSIAISSILLGSTKLTTATYGEFNDSEEREIAISACIVFPKYIEEQKEKAEELAKEMEEELEEALSTIEELKIDDFTKKVGEAIKEAAEGESAPPSSSAPPGDSSTVEGLKAVQAQLSSEITAAEGEIQSNTEKISQITELAAELQALQTALGKIAGDALPKVKEDIQNKTEQFKEIKKFIEEAREQVEFPCDYDPEFFPLIMDALTVIEEKTNKNTEKMEETIKQTEEQVKQFEKQSKQFEDNIKSLEAANESIKSKITALQQEIASIDTQIEQLIEKQKEEERLNKLKEEELKKEEEKKKEEEQKKLEEDKKKAEDQKKKEEAENSGADKGNDEQKEEKPAIEESKQEEQPAQDKPAESEQQSEAAESNTAG